MNPLPSPQDIVELFPRLYFFIPTIRRHSRKIDGITFMFDEPMDAILWFLEIITSDTGRPCLRSELKALVCMWYGKEASTAFDRQYKILDRFDFITWEQNADNNKMHEVLLTERGRLLLAEVKERRSGDVALFQEHIQSLPPEERDTFVRVLNTISRSAWDEMLNKARLDQANAAVNARKRKNKSKQASSIAKRPRKGKKRKRS